MGENHVTTDDDSSIATDQDGSAMSARALIWVANLAGVTLTERGILQKLANHAHQDGSSARPTVAVIADWAGLKPRNVRLVLTRLLGRRLIEVEGANGRTGGGRKATIYRVVIPDEYEPRHWRESHIRAWQDAHTEPAASDARRATATAMGGKNRHVAKELGRQKSACSDTSRAAKIDTLGRHSIAAKPVREPVPRKKNHSALPLGPRGGPDEGKVIDAMLGKIATSHDAPLAEGFRLCLAASLDRDEKAAVLLMLLTPDLGMDEAQHIVAKLEPAYGHRWDQAVEDLAECATLDPTPADPLRWLAARAAARAMH